ncbi:MAG: hypothetical protein A6F70_07800 [Cycloclasticus sp. symbiont of Bathymodiolus heckerae]|nr:MAG: hypothetical protein A6F70_07800 [Cycloclasticus sp. symbiont of Bathymodiolus heckerae]
MIRYLVGFALFLLALPLYAVQVGGLYSASVPVENQSQAVRNAAISEALKKVVVKVSGRKSTLGNVQLRSALSNVSAYVEQFQYKKRDDEQVGFWLTVSFQKAALDRVLSQFDVPVWGANRPDVLLWLAVDDGKRYLVNTEQKGLAAVLQQAAVDSGLVITLPLLDLEDQRSIGFNDVWAGFPEQIQRASTRYGAKYVIFAQLLKSGTNRYRFNWTLINNEGRYTGVAQSNSKKGAFQLAFSQLAENLADIYAPYGAVTKSQLIMEVSGVNNLESFVQVTRYLSSLDRVKKLSWGQLMDNKVTLELEVSGDGKALKDVITLNNVLTPDFAPQQAIYNPIDLQQLPAQRAPEKLFYRANN